MNHLWIICDIESNSKCCTIKHELIWHDWLLMNHIWCIPFEKFYDHTWTHMAWFIAYESYLMYPIWEVLWSHMNSYGVILLLMNHIWCIPFEKFYDHTWTHMAYLIRYVMNSYMSYVTYDILIGYVIWIHIFHIWILVS